MSFMVQDLLQEEVLKDVRVLGGNRGLGNEVKGVTIIEAPDIVRFIDGGEVLLSGLYAFKSCNIEEFKGYIYELNRKNASALVLKRGRDVEDADLKIKLLLEFAETYGVPVLEVPFEISFRDIMSLIMERLFNQEVTRLKYFKITHDNFTALTFSFRSKENGTEQILDVLAKLIRNPVAIFNQNKVRLASTDKNIRTLLLKKEASSYEPGIYSKHTYLKQKVCLFEGGPECNQYVVLLSVPYGVKMHLVITEINPGLNIMDCIAIENAITALQYEFSRLYAVTELEKKYQDDILHNILSGKIHSVEEMHRSTNLLEMDIDGIYRVIVFGMTDEDKTSKDLNSNLRRLEILSDAITRTFKQAKIHNDLNRIIVIQTVSPKQNQEEYRRELKTAVDKIQKKVLEKNKHMKIKAGAGRVVEGILNLPYSLKEANDAFLFVEIAGESSTGESSRIMLFSDLGIFKLLCQMNDPSMLMEYVPESLMKLYTYKKPPKADLLITLKTYLDRNQNLTKTAQDLYIHYKTAAYRVDKITSITGIDFDNASEVLAVRIGLVVCKMIENYNKILY